MAARKQGTLKGHYHNFGADFSNQLKNVLNDPMAIIRLNDDRLNLFGTIKSPKGNYSIVSVELNTVKDINSKYDAYNLVVSMLPAKDNYIRNLINDRAVSLEYKKEDLSQVNPQLYKWLSIINDKSSTNSISNTAEKVNKNIKETSTGYASGEMYFTMSYEQNGKIVGTLQYGEFDGKPNIKMIEVSPEYRRKGIASQLLQELQKKYPDQEIDFGMTTPDGAKLLESITYNVTDENVVADRKKLKELQTELNDLQERLDVLYDAENLTESQQAELEDLGDRWQTVYETIRELESKLKGKRSIKTFVKTQNVENSNEASDKGAFSMPESEESFSLSGESLRYNPEQYARWLMRRYDVPITDDRVQEYTRTFEEIVRLDNKGGSSRDVAESYIEALSADMALNMRDTVRRDSQEVLDYLKGTKISASEIQRSEIVCHSIFFTVCQGCHTLRFNQYELVCFVGFGVLDKPQRIRFC